VWRTAPALHRLAALACVALLAGCAGGFDLGRLDTDRSIITSSVDKAAGQQPDSRVSDEAAIRAAIAAWSPVAPADTVPWVNANTGSSGAITRIADSREGASLCRTFTASRDSFGGASRYRGKACSAGGGSWIVTDLNKG
jgi:surface antigen